MKKLEELMDHVQPSSRRNLLRLLVITPAAAILAACRPSDEGSDVPTTAPTSAQPMNIPATAAAQSGPAATSAPAEAAQTLPPTPACGDDDDEPTIAQTEGPFYTPDTPERTSLLEPGIEGTRLVVNGQILSTDCLPVAGALIDFWHCDNAGVYDNVGYKLRGHQFADADGRYMLETILPGMYPGRTRHIHVKVQAPNQPVLTTQLYFPGEPQNATDGIFHPDLVMDLQDTSDGRQGTFKFVLALA